jgi:hypothetical protein
MTPNNNTPNATVTAATKKGKTLKQYEQELKLKPRATQEHQPHRLTDNLQYADYYEFTDTALVDDDLLHLLYDSGDDDDDSDYVPTYDPFYDSDDDESYDDIPALQAPNIAIEELTTDGLPINTSHYYWYPEDDSCLPLTDNALLLPDPTDYLPETPQDLPAFAAYADRCLDACRTPELYSAMQYNLEDMFEYFMHGDLQGIDWDNAPHPQPDPIGDLTNMDTADHERLPRGGDPPGALLIPHDINTSPTSPAQTSSPPQDPTGVSFPATWTYPPPPTAPFDKQTDKPANTPPPSTTLSPQTVNDIDNTIDDTWTAKALATVAHTLLWGSASPVGRWACVPPLKKLRSKKMMMDSHIAATAFRHIRI